MYFTESEYLLRDGVAGKTAIEAVDAFLNASGPEDLVDAQLVARHTDQDPAEVEGILAALAAYGTVVLQPMVRCPNESCGVFTPAARVETARKDGDEEPCDGPCGQDLASRDDLDVVNAYKVPAPPLL